MRSIPTKFPSQRFPTRGLNLARDGKLNLAEHDGINKLPVNAMNTGLNIVFGGEELVAQNYYDAEETIAYNASRALSNADVITDTELQNYYIRGFHVNGTGNAVITLWATVLGRGTASGTDEMSVLAQGTIDIDNPHIRVMLPNPVQVADGGQLKLNIWNTSGASADYASTIYGVSTSEQI